MGRLGLSLLRNAPRSICAQGIEKLNLTDNVQELIDFYKQNIDFCLDNNFPDTDILLSQESDFLKQNGIFINENMYLQNVAFVVSLEKSVLDVIVSNFKVSQIFAKQTSKIKLLAKDNAHVTIDIFDEVYLKAETTGEAKIFVNVYGKAKVEATGKIEVIYKNRDKY